MRILSRRTIGVAAGVVPLVAAGVFGSAPAGASAQSGRSSVAGTRPAWAAASADTGRASGSNRVDLRVWLSLRDPAAVSQFVASVTDPSSPNYGHYMTPAQFDAAYAPTASQAQAVASWLKASGLSVTDVASTNRYVAASGSVAQVERAFAVNLDNYAVHGQSWRAPAGDPSVPSDLGSTVLTISGLDTGDHSNHPASSGAINPPAAYVNATPMSAWYGQLKDNTTASGGPALPRYDGHVLPWVDQGYTPPQLRSAYGVAASGLTGAGTTVAIVDAYYSSTIVSDVNTYVAAHDPGSVPLTAGSNYFESLPQSFTNNGTCGASGWQGEETLDVEAVHGIAPAANIRYFGAASCQDPDLMDALTRAVQDPSVNVISNSWGGLETQTTPGLASEYESIFQQAIAEGMTVAFSSGDNGDELANTGTKQADYPTSDPYVTSVGGTSIGVGKSGTLVGQDGWGTDKASYNSASNSWNTATFFYGAGGGCSVLFAQPAYQSRTANVAADCGSARALPDVSMDADPNTGYLIGETQLFNHKAAYGEYRIGGTSLACPLFSAMLALADQQAGHSIAEANTVLYRLRSGITDVTPTTGDLPDVANVRADYVNSLDPSAGTVYSARTFGQDSSLPVAAGWDEVTGLGTLNGSVFGAMAKLAR